MIKYIYAEKDALRYPAARRVTAVFNNASVITVDNYKDIFSRPGQSFALQKEKPAIILAVNRSGFIYRGSDNCQNFGNSNFYYCSCVKNCFYSCDYCYLQGMYRSGNIVVFVNIEDCFEETRCLMAEYNGRQDVYMCLSYDTDIFAMESVLGYVKEWNSFAAENAEGGFTAEIRTKSGEVSFFRENQPNDAMIFAWTVAPESAVKAFEKRTAPLDARLKAARTAAENGFKVRLCLDPVINTGLRWRDDYKALVHKIAGYGLTEIIDSISVGVFRLPAEYLKIMRRNAPLSPMSWYNYTADKGTVSYGEALVREMNGYIKRLLTEAGVKESIIYGWER